MTVSKLESIFNAYPKTVLDFLISEGQGYYIPSYQRQYSWDNENVERLIEDSTHGIFQLIERDQVISFLGSIIAIESKKSIKPVYKPELPSSVCVIIDGQQRICTLLLFNIAFQNSLLRYSKLLEKSKELGVVFLLREAKAWIDKLGKTIFMDMSSGDELFQYYPRIIRAHKDIWSRVSVQAKYKSPIARLIWAYINHIHKSGEKSFSYKYDGTDPAHIKVNNIFKTIQKSVLNFAENPESVFPSNIQLIDDQFCERLWGFSLPNDLRDFIKATRDEKEYTDAITLFRIVTFAKYITGHMAFAIVKTENEDDAFDMFEALNTTGTPLTAIETFIPKIIEDEGIEKYEATPSYKYITMIEAYLSKFEKADAKQKATTSLLIPFALYEDGDKVKNKLNDQRRYLRNKYSELLSIDDKRDFVKSLSSMAMFIDNIWVNTNKAPDFSPLLIEDKEAIFCLEFLRSINHTVTIAHMYRFYEHLVEDPIMDAPKKGEIFSKCIKATAAFSILWRAVKGGTANIDSHYRNILKNGVDSSMTGGPIYPPLGRHRIDKRGAVSIDNYVNMLKAYLNKDRYISDPKAWISNVSGMPIYEQKTVARILLFCATSDAIVDESNPGLIRKGRAGILPLLDPETWKSDKYLTVEHIAPQSNDGSWDTSLYSENRNVHQIGNLILLPKDENNLIGNKGWEIKKKFYNYLSSENIDDIKKLESELKADGVKLSGKAKDILKNSNYLPMCKSISKYLGDWDQDFVKKRSERLAELAFNKLISWI